MRFPIRGILVLSTLLLPAIVVAQSAAPQPMPPSQTVPLGALVDLHKASVSDDVLLALIDSSMTVYQLTAADVRGLRDAGFSDKLIIGILNTAPRARAISDQQAAAIQQLWAQQGQQPPPPIQAIGAQGASVDQENQPPDEYVASTPSYGVPTLPYGAGVLVPVASARRTPRPAVPRSAPPQAPLYFVVPAVHPAPRNQPVKAPEYWGFGGQLRPDAWKEPGPGRGGGGR